MGDLKISNATYGRSESGSRIIQNSFNAAIEKAYAALSKDNKNYITLCQTIKSYWSGSDANAFLKLLDDQRASIQNKIKKYNNVLTSALESDRVQFEKSQSSIANTISGNIKI